MSATKSGEHVGKRLALYSISMLLLDAAMRVRIECDEQFAMHFEPLEPASTPIIH